MQQLVLLHCRNNHKNDIELLERGRRNVATKEQLDYITGKRYEAQKNIELVRDQKGVFKSDAPPVDILPMDDQGSSSRSD